jgi:hypothetical protein
VATFFGMVQTWPQAEHSKYQTTAAAEMSGRQVVSLLLQREHGSGVGGTGVRLFIG